MFRPDRHALAYLSGLFFLRDGGRPGCREGRFLRGLPAACCLRSVGRSVYSFLLPFAPLFWRLLEHFNFAILRGLRKQTPAVEA